ncbi:MAG: FtsX-like permease family protein [Pseudomonadota bacterium]|nr:FtsX-like permease family protein [Pseudomonadota bacterium]
MRLSLIARLAWRDLTHSWGASLCLALAAAVALVPVLLLFGLNYGFVSGLIEDLRRDPLTRELRPVGQYALDADWFAARRDDPRVDFVLPRTRYLASSAEMRAAGAPGLTDVELIPSAPGDPLLGGGAAPDGAATVALTLRAAQAAKVAVGDAVELVVVRRVGERRERETLRLTVTGLIESSAYPRAAVFASSLLVDEVERWREGGEAPTFGWAGDPDRAGRRTWASFRLYARDVRDVPAMRAELLARNMDVRTEAEAISRALAIERGLGAVFLAILALASGGVLLTLGFQLAAATAEKRGDLAILRMLGLESLELGAIPMVQGGMIAGSAAAAAGLAVLAAQPLVNLRLAGLGGFDGPMSRLEPWHALAATLAMAAAGAAAGVAAGRQAIRAETSEGLRHD